MQNPMFAVEASDIVLPLVWIMVLVTALLILIGNIFIRRMTALQS